MLLLYRMEEINISKLSPKVLSRLAKGLPVRIRGGDDVKMVVDAKEAKKILKSFMKGKGVTKAFSDREIEDNARIGGKGIFGKRFDKFLKRLGTKAGFNVKKAVYKVGDVIKPFAKQAIKTGLDAVATVADPFLGNVGVASTITDGISKKADQFLDKPSDFGMAGSGLYAGTGLYASGGGFYSPEGTYHPNKALTHSHNFNRHRDMHNSIGKGLYAQTKIKGSGKKDILNTPAMKKARKILNPFGGGQLQRNVPDNELASIGLGGDLLSKYEQHPAMRSQPYSVNFAWGNTLPKWYQQFSNGLQ